MTTALLPAPLMSTQPVSFLQLVVPTSRCALVFGEAVDFWVLFGGGVIIVPVLYLMIGLPLNFARGTSALMVGFSAAAASTVYMINGLINYEIAASVILGIIIGGKIGGKLGAMAKPKPPPPVALLREVSRR